MCVNAYSDCVSRAPLYTNGLVLHYRVNRCVYCSVSKGQFHVRYSLHGPYLYIYIVMGLKFKARFTLSRLLPVEARCGIRGESVDIGVKNAWSGKFIGVASTYKRCYNDNLMIFVTEDNRCYQVLVITPDVVSIQARLWADKW